ncbi:MAG: UvrD-helicase domain-containing protein [Candidatus Ancillula sp.]|jgi:DNA helicase-2/ATP-dependent DNA helicase PcrA|nr:UvrD-helicase domain-containing protein [Candidatus Ancillula sp.]
MVYVEFEKQLEKLNPEQLEAVKYNGTDLSPSTLMIVAGAGSGKTSVLTNKIAYILHKNLAMPYQILAITFTNKAANEMRERIGNMLESMQEQLSFANIRQLWVSTFHGACVRILRKWHEKLNLASSFTIYDAQDSRRLIKDILEELNIDVKAYPPKLFAKAISDLKNDLQTPDDYSRSVENINQEQIYKVYARYAVRLQQLDALDFDDLIGRTIELLSKNEDVREFYTEKFRYIFVDEYQDTNRAQYILIRLLSGYGFPRYAPKSSRRASITVVGDQDQSIYAFRGATIRNIQEFEADFPNAKTILLEQNYRSVNTILKVANAVISKNNNRKKKNLWSAKGDGPKVKGYASYDAYAEANYVIKEIQQLRDTGEKCSEIAVFFRTNSASRIFEEKLVNANIPYKIVGGTKFYDRREIRDVIAYLFAILNRHDDVHLRRILNVPKRGIGKTTEDKVVDSAYAHGCSFGDVLEMLEDVDNINEGTRTKLNEFSQLLKELEDALDSEEVADLGAFLELVAEKSGMLNDLSSSNDPQDKVRVENIYELIQAAGTFVPIDNPDDEEYGLRRLLELFLEQVSLSSDTDEIPDKAAQLEGFVTLMTLHASKGLEFDSVFLTGFEDGSLPHSNSFDSEFELSEERRLAYVGITRARKNLYITYATRRNLFGNWFDFTKSRFADDIPDELIEWDTTSGFTSSFDSGKGYRKRNHDEVLDDPWKGESTIGGRRGNVQNSKLTYGGSFSVGDFVTHLNFGLGVIKKVEGSGSNETITVEFIGGDAKIKKLVAKTAPITKI